MSQLDFLKTSDHWNMIFITHNMDLQLKYKENNTKDVISIILLNSKHEINPKGTFDIMKTHILLFQNIFMNWILLNEFKQQKNINY